MPTAPVMDEGTENAFRQLLGVAQDKPLPSQIRHLWVIAKLQHDRWMSGGPLPAPDVRHIALLYTARVMLRFAGKEEDGKEKTEKDST